MRIQKISGYTPNTKANSTCVLKLVQKSDNAEKQLKSIVEQKPIDRFIKESSADIKQEIKESDKIATIASKYSFSDFAKYVFT